MTTIEVVESRSDDDTTCSASCYSSSSVAPSESEEEVRDGGEETFADEVDNKDTVYMYSDDERSAPGAGRDTDRHGRTAHGEPSNHRTGAAGELLAIPESIPEEVEPASSTEDSELSAGSKATETTEETLDVSYGSNSAECRIEDAPPTGSTSHNARENCSDAEEDEDLVNAPSDEAVLTTRSSDETSVKVEKDPTDLDGKGLRTNTTDIADAEFFAESALQNEKDGLALARQQWAEAMATLQKNPALMTGDILELALQHRAPLHVVRSMVDLNPDAAGVPRSGPSALQVAVRRGCSIDVIEVIIRACPYALFDSCGQTYDPLSLTKIHRREDSDLIEMLSRPISYWIGDGPTPGKKTVRFEPFEAPPTPTRQSFTSFPPPPPPPPVLKSPSRLTRDEKRELANVKLITAAIVKAQKKQMAETEENRRKIKAWAKSEAKARREMVKFIDERMTKNAKAHLISLDMKERAFLSRIDSVSKQLSGTLDASNARQERLDGERERRDLELQKSVEDAMATIVAAADKIGKATASYDAKLSDLAAQVGRLEDTAKAPYDFEEPSFEIESLTETNSTDHLFSDDFTCNGIDDSHIGDYTPDQIQHSFSSEWNASTQGLVTNEQVYIDASWWQQLGTNEKTAKKRGISTSRWMRWIKLGKLG